MGINDIDEELVWKTSDGSTDVTFENWYEDGGLPTLGQPGQDKDCVVSDPWMPDGQWYDTICTEEHPFICEFLE